MCWISICIFFGISVDDYLESQKAKLTCGVDNLSNTTKNIATDTEGKIKVEETVAKDKAAKEAKEAAEAARRAEEERAKEEARRIGRNVVGTEMFLLGILGEGTNVVAEVLSDFEITIKDARLVVENLVGFGNEYYDEEEELWLSSGETTFEQFYETDYCRKSRIFYFSLYILKKIK